MKIRRTLSGQVAGSRISKQSQSDNVQIGDGTLLAIPLDASAVGSVRKYLRLRQGDERT